MFFRRILVLFIVLFSTVGLKAQLDLEHWFAPIFKGFDTDSNDIILYLSTPHETPFKVDIYGNNVLRKTVFISKNSPYIYNVMPGDFILSKFGSMEVKSKGLHVVGANSFFASIRLNFDNRNTEIISSKGKTALGKTFHSVNVPNGLYEKFEKNNITTSIIATQDNTKIKVSGYSNKIIFGGHFNPNFSIDLIEDDQINFTLNKGESYTILAWKKYNFSVTNNFFYDTLPGFLIEADKNITVTNGNFTGNYFFESHPELPEFGKLLIDQNLPINKLGKQYFLKKGFSTLDKLVEKGFIIATKNNTKIYLNGETSPNKILNKGQHYIIPTENFVNDGIYINSSEPIYFYQLMAGTDAFGGKAPLAYDSPAMALVPSLDETLPKTIDYIPKVGFIGNRFFGTMLHVLTPKNKNISVNDAPVSFSDGPFNIQGNDDWQYFTLKNISGDVKISSEGAVILGTLGGFFNHKMLGSFAGYYTGFSNDPFIKKNGNCIQEGVLLSLNNIDFEGFQWQLNGVDIPGATQTTFTPILPGNYTCALSYSGFKYTTTAVSVALCPYAVTTTNIGIICPDFNLEPKFTAPNENLAVTSVEILVQPNHGSVLYQTPLLKISNDENYVGIDRFVYRVCAANGFCETRKIEFTLLPSPIADVKESIDSFNQIENKFYYNLNSAINNSNSESFHFFENLNDAENNSNEIITEIENYQTSALEVFVKVVNAQQCSVIKKIILNPKQIVPEIPRLPNVFTPNDDGYNDVWDYSLLKTMENLNLRVYDRYGKNIYQHTADNQNFHWDGKEKSGVSYPTSVYWVYFDFFNPKVQLFQQGSMWIFLKNRNKD